MSRKLILLCLSFCMVLCGWAQMVVVGQLVDGATNQPLGIDHRYSVSMMNEDSAILSNIMPVVYEKADGQSQHTTYVEAKLRLRGTYILWIYIEGFESRFVKFKVDKESRGRTIDLGKIVLKREARQTEKELGEATIVAQRLKFYFDKDTLVYNAVSYMQQSGAMLGTILSQMPGLEIKPDGEIFANGKRVNTLLLNGKDFFDKDRVTLLANLPAYAVKQVKVYEQKDPVAGGFDRERFRSGQILDIILKPDYSSSTFGNINFGYGTDKHYYAKLFGMTYSKYHRISAYAITNDINRNEMLQIDGTAQNIDNGLGEKKHHKMGLNYNYDDYKKRFTVGGGVELLWANTFTTLQSVTQHVLSQGESYSYKRNISDFRNFSLKTNHEINPFANKSYSFVIKPTFSYARANNKGESFSAMTMQDVQTIELNWLDSLKQQRQSQLLNLYGINRSIYKVKHLGEVTMVGVTLSKRNFLRDDIGTWSAEGSWDWYKHNNRNYEQRDIEYMRNGGLNSWQNQFIKDRAERNLLKLQSSYDFVFAKYNSLNVTYGLEYVDYNANHSLFALDALNGWGRTDNPILGMLPSYHTMLSAIDAQNSYEYFECQTLHKVALGYTYQRTSRGMAFPTKLQITVPLTFENKSLDFSQIGKSELVNRRYVRPEFNVNFTQNRKGGVYMMVGYDYMEKSPTMYNLVSIVNTSNPLLQMRGNNGLRKQKQHRIFGQYFKQKHLDIFNLSVSANFYDDQIAMTTLYDRQSGQITYTPQNIDGNYSIGTNLRNNIYLNLMGTSSISNNLSFDFEQSVDYQTFVGEGVERKSRVLNRIIKEEFSYNQVLWQQKVRLSLSAYCNYLHTNSNRSDYQRAKAFDYGLKFVVNAHLPWSLLLSTDLTSVSRRGYNYAPMNNDEYIWNMRLTKAFGERLQLQFEVNDILKQRKSVYYWQNAQGRIEEIYNNMRRYAMLHLIWNFGKQVSR